MEEGMEAGMASGGGEEGTQERAVRGSAGELVHRELHPQPEE